MSKRILIILALLLLSLAVINWPNLIAKIKTQIPQIERIAPTPLSEQEVLDQINVYRTANKMIALKRNDKLDKTALSRLTVIRDSQDFSGEKTGVSLENAVTNNDYNFSTTGEIDVNGVTGETKLADELVKDAEQKKILNDKNYRDAGIAVVREGLSYRVVIIMARLMVVKVEKLGAGGYPVVAWGGPELWAAVNKRRVELGVNPLKQLDIFCTIASIRLNQLLELGKLDGHEGFEGVLNRFPEVRQKYNVAEFLIVGYLSPTEAVAGWEHTLGHRGLLAGGEYVWGCVYSQETFGVAIAAY